MRRLAYSTLWGSPDTAASEDVRPFMSSEDAKKARDEKYRQLKKEGRLVRRSVMKGQLRQYWSFGVPCGHMCDVYEIYFN